MFLAECQYGSNLEHMLSVFRYVIDGQLFYHPPKKVEHGMEIGPVKAFCEKPSKVYFIYVLPTRLLACACLSTPSPPCFGLSVFLSSVRPLLSSIGSFLLN